jgi:hypothetical protein
MTARVNGARTNQPEELGKDDRFAKGAAGSEALTLSSVPWWLEARFPRYKVETFAGED